MVNAKSKRTLSLSVQSELFSNLKQHWSCSTQTITVLPQHNWKFC